MLDQTYSEEFEVELIVDEKMIDGETHFLVKWLGYGHQENTWEPLRHMANSKDKIQNWQKFKLKQLTLLQTHQTLNKLDLGPQNTKNPTDTHPAFIEASKRSSTPHRNFKPIILNDAKDKPGKFLEQDAGKTISLFDRPEVKKITKRKKIERKKKELEMFEQRMKSRPKVWEKYIENEDEAIKLANQKIKQVVDQVFGTKTVRFNPEKKTIDLESIEENPHKSRKSQIHMSVERNLKDQMRPQNLKHKMESQKKSKRKNLQIFSDSEEETSHQPRLSTKRSLSGQKLFEKKDSSQEIDESTNFLPEKKVHNQILKPKQYGKYGKQKEKEPKVQQNSFQQSKGKLTWPTKTEQNCDVALSKEKDINGPSSKIVRTMNPQRQNFIHPETIRLTSNIIEEFGNKDQSIIQTEDSSQSHQLEDECKIKIYENSSSSSSSNSFNEYQGFNSIENKNRDILHSKIPQNSLPQAQAQQQKTYRSKQNETSQKNNENVVILSEKEKAHKNHSAKFEVIQPKQEDQHQLQLKFDQIMSNIASNPNEFHPFECSASSIEGPSANNKNFEESSNYILDKHFKNIIRTNDNLPEQNQGNQHEDSQHSASTMEQRIINYSSMTNHRSTALPSEASGQSYHVFTSQNVFNLNFLRNRSLSTRASENTHKTEFQSEKINISLNSDNLGDGCIEKQELNSVIYQSKPQHIFSSSSEIEDRINVTDEQKRSIKMDSNESSLESSPIILNFMEIGSQNQGKASKKTSKGERHQCKGKTNVQDKAKEFKKERSLSQINQKRITEQALTEN